MKMLLIKPFNLYFLELSSIFNNREIAIGFWILVFILFALSIKGVRKEIPRLLNTLFDKKLILLQITMVSYFVLVLFVLWKIDFWEVSLLKDTIVWFLIVNTISTGNAIINAKNISYFSEVLKENFKLFIIVEFIINLYSFSIIVEIILIFFLVLIQLLLVVAEGEAEKNKIVVSLLNWILAIIGFFILLISLIYMLKDISDITNLSILREILLIPILTIFSVVSTYFLVILTSYELLFMRLNFLKIISETQRNYLYFRILMVCNFRLTNINSFIKKSNIMSSRIETRDDVKEFIERYKDS